MYGVYTGNPRVNFEEHEKDDIILEVMGSPALRFVEKGGETLMEKIGQSDPWKGETFYMRADCLHCKGRYIIAKEQEDKAAAKLLERNKGQNPQKAHPH